jgi:hypothetical protein
MNLHRLRIDMRLQRSKVIGEFGQFVRHESSS